MKSGIKWLMVGALLLIATVAGAANWDKIQQRLQSWPGAKEVTLPAEVDPLDESPLSPLVNTLLEQGYALLPAASTNKSGLVIETRTTGKGEIVALKRAADGALLAMERLPATVKAPPAATSAPVTSPVAVQPAPAPATPVAVTPVPASTPTVVYVGKRKEMEVVSVQHPQQLQQSPGEAVFELNDTPMQMVMWPTSDGFYDLFFLYDNRIEKLHYSNGSLRPVATFATPVKPTRALHLDIGDMNSDGQPELAAVWAEDVYDVAAGTNSLLHSWILTVTDNGMTTISDDLGGYIKLDNQRAFYQKRAEFKAFANKVYPLTMHNNRVTVAAEPVNSSSAQLIFDQLVYPDGKQSLVWNKNQRLILAAANSNERIVGSTLLTDFGQYHGPYVSIPLADPGYRGGFSSTDRVLAKNVYLGRRMQMHNDTIYTIVRGRSNGMMLLGNTSGADKLVAITGNGTTLSTSFPFAAVDAFIIDFCVYGNSAPKALLLLNEKADGSGSAYLRMQ